MKNRRPGEGRRFFMVSLVDTPLSDFIACLSPSEGRCKFNRNGGSKTSEPAGIFLRRGIRSLSPTPDEEALQWQS
jgi:hypothetical protein